MKGNVTISIEDFDSLRESSKTSQELIKSLKRAALELEVFLSFLIEQENIDEHIEQFNRQSKRSQIVISNGRAKIQINELED